MAEKEDIFDKQYLVQHLIYYVEHQLEEGYGLDDLEEALLHYGYEKEVVDEVIHHMKHSPGRLKPAKKHDMQHIAHDLYYYTENLLIDYIMRELEKGYKLPEIEKNLLKHGHDHKLVEKALTAVKSGKVEDIEHPLGIHLPRQLLFGISLFVVFIFVIFLSITTNSSIGLVLLSFAPTFFTIALINLVFTFVKSRPIINFLPLAALAIVAGIFIGFIQTLPAMRATQEHIILVLNCTLTFLGSAFICYFSSVEKKKKLPIGEAVEEKKEEKVEKKAFELTPSKESEEAVKEYTEDLTELVHKEAGKKSGKRKVKLKKI